MNSQHFQTYGYAIAEDVIEPIACDEVAHHVPTSNLRSGGSRILLKEAWCCELISRLLESPIIGSLVPTEWVPVQCTYFQKSHASNWFVPLHQDLSVPVEERVPDPQLKGWAQKEGQLFVQVPEQILATLVAVRLHLDPCGANDGALIVLAGSHLKGRLSASEIKARKDEYPEHVCLVNKGGALVFRPLLLHRSMKSTGVGLRRVLHFLFGPPELPFGLKWARS